MDDLTLESLAKRVEALEAKQAEKESGGKNPQWWNALGTVTNDEVAQSMIVEMNAIREAEREAARKESD